MNGLKGLKMELYGNIKTKREYDLLLESGMFWVAYPELTGEWEKDKIIIQPNDIKRYEVIYADPAWSYKFNKPTASKGGASGDGYSAGVNYYYETMTMQEIKEMPVNEIADKNAVLFMWATNPLLPEALETMKAWGFKYKTCITWKKERCKGMGYWFRGHTEHLLFGVKGKVKAFRSLEHNIQVFPVEKHSKKPDWFRKLIEDNTIDMPNKLELFARQSINNWDCFGNEVENSIDLSEYYT